jgi:hypothetical protein
MCGSTDYIHFSPLVREIRSSLPPFSAARAHVPDPTHKPTQPQELSSLKNPSPPPPPPLLPFLTHSLPLTARFLMQYFHPSSSSKASEAFPSLIASPNSPPSPPLVTGSQNDDDDSPARPLYGMEIVFTPFQTINQRHRNTLLLLLLHTLD